MPAEYWASRSTLNYYRTVRELLEKMGPCGSLLDVGSWDTPVVTWGTFRRRYTCDLGHDPRFAGVVSHVGDFLSWRPPELMDAVTCLQVLEHLPDAEARAFGRKLLETGRTVIVSVPYLWAPGVEPDHVQDPIDLAKLERLMGERAKFSNVIEDGPQGSRPRLVAIWIR
jgi:hypothetical protein